MVNPVHNSTRKGYTGIVRGGGAIVGAGATPSMGLSQRRGGGLLKKLAESAGVAYPGGSARFDERTGTYRGGAKLSKSASARISNAARLGKDILTVVNAVIASGEDAEEAVNKARVLAEIHQRHDQKAPLAALAREIAQQKAGEGAEGLMALSKGSGRRKAVEYEEAVGGGFFDEPPKHGGRKKKVSAADVGKKELEAHSLAHKALESESDEESAYGMGRQLGHHVQSLHGAGFWEDFKKGFSAVGSIAAPLIGMIPHPAAKAASVGLTGLSALAGLGRHGGMDTGAYEGEGRKKKVKRAVGATDGRRKRAEIVKKVMGEKGLSMVEASKYVKEHGLYQK